MTHEPPEAVPFIEKIPFAAGGLPVEKLTPKLPLSNNGAQRADPLLPEPTIEIVLVATGTVRLLAGQVPLPVRSNDVEPGETVIAGENVTWTLTRHAPFHPSAEEGRVDIIVPAQSAPSAASPTLTLSNALTHRSVHHVRADNGTGDPADIPAKREGPPDDRADP